MFVICSEGYIKAANAPDKCTEPYLKTAMPDGQPVLGCARPNCFESTEGLTVSSEMKMSYPRHVVAASIDFSNMQWNAKKVSSQTRAQVTISGTVLQCCTFEPLRLSSNRGVATVKPGQIVIGGEVNLMVLNNEAFDYISNVEKQINADGTVTYKVGMRRFYCPPPVEAVPERQEMGLAYSKRHEQAVLVANTETLSNISNRKKALDFVVCALYNRTLPDNEKRWPLLAADGQAVDGEDVVVEEVVAQEGVEVPDTTEESDEEPVRVITGEEKRLDDLKVNDWVQTLKGAEIKYAPVSFWLHRVPSQKAEFIRMSHAFAFHSQP
ncbi:hypothetical protein TELCIR_16801 [Teladorsagia circumcincta]|uniref:Uncharacterized protein n=1 Tax=Teladorsagia circumcincta TaxID=45464 RepID=A0A2G9TUT4_TELCI|nr:hypothetical protein TELCIR_16801 [Teladorsagia circumcincta]